MAFQPSHTPGTLTSGIKTVASTATPEALGTGQYHWVDVQALNTNTQEVTIADSSVVHGASQRGIMCSALDVYTLYDVDIAQVYIDVEVNAEGVTWVGLKR